MQIEQLIQRLGLEPHPEGGFYRETYRSDETLAETPGRYDGPRSLGTAIYFLVTADSFSAMHRLRTDEVFHFYFGDPVTMLQLGPDGTGRQVRLGQDIAAGQVPQAIVPRDVWQGTRLDPGGRFALLGTTVAPGFDFADFEYGDREELVAAYPGFAEEIRSLTREG